ncbi:hypothetical protein [Burkholderia multivorans]|uniref:hypothetical protein n=1 Tax=Burkholderia multivorans TaxID=87883 RepID=UPI0013DF902E|nr:hypothetical protein [Burkholderia multivorans]MBU9618962.1 hypothetical protein [Burkholderia multivorans]NGM76432.1 hypothetical protein [Burkholderia multivorans]
MSYRWIRHSVSTDQIPGIPDKSYPLAVLGYGGMYSKLEGKTRKVAVSFQRLDVDGDPPFHTKISLAHLRDLQVGSVWQNRRHVGDIRYDRLSAVVDFSPDRWRIFSPVQEVQAGRPAPFYGKYRPTLKDERKERSWFLEFSLPDGRTLMVPCLEFLLRCYGASAIIPRALTSKSWEDAVKLFLTSTTPETNSEGRWVIRPTDRMVKADRSFLGHILHSPEGRQAAKSLVDQCVQASHGEELFFPQVTPWFSTTAPVSAEGIWIRPGKSFLALRIKLTKDPAGHPISEVRILKNETSRHEDAQSPNDAYEGSPRFTLSPESRLKLRGLDEEHNFGGGPPEKRMTSTPWFPLGSGRDITTVYERQSSIIVPPSAANCPSVHPTTDGATDKPEMHRVVVAHGTLLEMWNALRSLKGKHPRNLLSVEWLDAKRGFVGDDLPELIALQPFGDMEDVAPAIRQWVSKDIKIEPPRGILVLRVQAIVPKTLEAKTVYILEIERRVKPRGSGNEKVEQEAERFRGLVAVLAQTTDFDNWLRKTLSQIRYTEGKIVELKSLQPDLIDAFKHSQSRDAKATPYLTSALLALTKAGVNL